MLSSSQWKPSTCAYQIPQSRATPKAKVKGPVVYPSFPFRPLSCPSHGYGGGKQSSELGAQNPSPHPHPHPPHHRPLPRLPALRGHPHPLLPPLGLPSLPLPGPLLFLSFSSPPLVLLPLPLPRRPPRPPPLLLALQVPLPAAPSPCPLLRRRGGPASLGSRGAAGLLPDPAEAGPPRRPRPAYLGLRHPQPRPPLAALLGPHLAPSPYLKRSAHQRPAFTTICRGMPIITFAKIHHQYLPP